MTIMNLGKLIFLSGMILFSLFSTAKTVVVKENGNWKLYVDNMPFQIKGVTWGREVSAETIGSYMKDLKESSESFGGNDPIELFKIALTLPNAFNTPSAFTKHSSYSSSATESATIAPPT